MRRIIGTSFKALRNKAISSSLRTYEDHSNRYHDFANDFQNSDEMNYEKLKAQSDEFIENSLNFENDISEEISTLLKPQNVLEKFKQTIVNNEKVNKISLFKRIIDAGVQNPKLMPNVLLCFYRFANLQIFRGLILDLAMLYPKLSDDSKIMLDIIVNTQCFSLRRLSAKYIRNLFPYLFDRFGIKGDSIINFDVNNWIVIEEIIKNINNLDHDMKINCMIFLLKESINDKNLKIDTNEYLLEIKSYVLGNMNMLNWNMSFYYWNIFFKLMNPTLDQIVFFAKTLKIDSIESSAITISFWVNVFYQSSEVVINELSRDFLQFRRLFNNIEFSSVDIFNELPKLMYLINIWIFLHDSKKSKDKRFQVKSICRVIETFLIRCSDNIIHDILGNKEFYDQLSPFTKLSLLEFYQKMFNIYYSQNAMISESSSDIFIEFVSDTFQFLNDTHLNNLSRMIVHINNDTLSDHYVDEIHNRISGCSHLKLKLIRLKDLIHKNNIFYAAFKYDVSKIITDLENIGKVICDISSLHYYLSIIIEIILLEQKYSSPLIGMYIKLYQNLTLNEYVQTRTYLYIKILTDSKDIPESIEELNFKLQQKKPMVPCKSTRSFLQINFEDFLQRNNIKITVEKSLLGFHVDIFVHPNIVIEILGDFHYNKNCFEKCLLRKVRILAKGGYKVILASSTATQNPDTQNKILETIQKMISSS